MAIFNAVVGVGDALKGACTNGEGGGGGGGGCGITGVAGDVALADLFDAAVLAVVVVFETVAAGEVDGADFGVGLLKNGAADFYDAGLCNAKTGISRNGWISAIGAGFQRVGISSSGFFNTLLFNGQQDAIVVRVAHNLVQNFICS